MCFEVSNYVVVFDHPTPANTNINVSIVVYNLYNIQRVDENRPFRLIVDNDLISHPNAVFGGGLLPMVAGESHTTINTTVHGFVRVALEDTSQTLGNLTAESLLYFTPVYAPAPGLFAGFLLRPISVVGPPALCDGPTQSAYVVQALVQHVISAYGLSNEQVVVLAPLQCVAMGRRRAVDGAAQFNFTLRLEAPLAEELAAIFLALLELKPQQVLDTTNKTSGLGLTVLPYTNEPSVVISNVDCTRQRFWSAWTACQPDCGNVTRIRSRTRICPPMAEEEECAMKLECSLAATRTTGGWSDASTIGLVFGLFILLLLLVLLILLVRRRRHNKKRVTHNTGTADLVRRNSSIKAYQEDWLANALKLAAEDTRADVSESGAAATGTHNTGYVEVQVPEESDANAGIASFLLASSEAGAVVDEQPVHLDSEIPPKNPEETSAPEQEVMGFPSEPDNVPASPKLPRVQLVAPLPAASEPAPVVDDAASPKPARRSTETTATLAAAEVIVTATKKGPRRLSEEEKEEYLRLRGKAYTELDTLTEAETELQLRFKQKFADPEAARAYGLL